jgi:hypothetical protein
MVEQGPVGRGEALENLRVGGELLAHFDEGPDDEEARLDRLRAVQDGCRHDGAVVGEGMGQVRPPAAGNQASRFHERRAWSWGVAWGMVAG